MARRLTFLTWRDRHHPDGGGSEVYVEEIARRLAAGGARVTILCAHYAGARRREVIDGVLFLRRGGRLTVYLHGLAYLLSRTGRQQDIVIDVINGLPFAARLVRRRGLIALVHHVHQRQWQIIYPGLRGRIGWFTESRVTPRLYRHVRHVTVSASSRDDLVALGLSPDLITIVHNGLEVVDRREQVSRSTSPRICVLSRLVPHKRIHDALRVAATLRSEFPDLRIDVIGSGWWSDELRRAALSLRVDDIVVFHGHLDDAARDQLLATAWLMLLPSVKEGWGLVVLEAAAQGTPTIAYASAGGVTESIVDGDTGALVADLGDMVRTTRRLLVDAQERRRLSNAAAAWAGRFSWEATTRAFEAVLDAIATDSVPAGQREP